MEMAVNLCAAHLCLKDRYYAANVFDLLERFNDKYTKSPNDKSGTLLNRFTRSLLGILCLSFKVYV